MRLIHLEFEGVGSFAQRMEIDFESLGSAGLFLIEGPTGSGKSTILDAIVFALYGSPAGSDSDPGRLDSHVRDSNREPFVELDFAIAGATYRIRRTPRHERDKKRGTGMKVDDGGVSLVRLTPDPAGISSKAKEVGDWVIEHVGLSKQQFVSTIVLAQGEFASFLNAETRERTPILERVFGTEFYQDVEQQLAQMRRDALASRAQAANAFTEAVDRCLGLLGLETSDDAVAEIDAELIRLQARIDQAEAEAAQSEVSLRTTQARLSAAQQLAAAQVNKRLLLGRQQELEQRAAGIAGLRAALSEHDRATPAMAALQAWRTAQQKALQAGAHLEDERCVLAGLGEAEATDERLEEITSLRASLAHAADREAQLPGLRQDESRLQDAVRAAQAAVAVHSEERERLLVQIAEARQEAQRSAGDGERLAELGVQRTDLLKQIETGERLAEETGAMTMALKAREQAQRSLDEVLGRLAEARRAQLVNLAGTLASQLVEGEACLVCGSVEHPAPARRESGVTEMVSELGALAEQRRADVQRAGAQCDQLDGRLKVLRADTTVDPAEAAARLVEIEEQVEHLRSVIKAADAATAKQRAAESTLTTVSEALTVARIDAEKHAADLEAVQARLSEAVGTVTAAVGDHPSVSARVEVLTTVRRALAATLEAQRVFSSARATADHARQTMDTTLSDLGFPDAQAAESAILDVALAGEYRVQIEQFDADVLSVAAALRDLDGIDLETVADVPALLHEVAQQQDAHTAAHKELGSLQHIRRGAVPLRAQVGERAVERDQVLADSAGVIRMADLATATRGEGIHRVRLSAFVLMRRFEAVVEAANDRLDAISEGRYQLQVEHQGLDNRGQHGLDLVVLDQRTERCRPTTSLSGGESFYVSLALALGLADVVRSESGGVSLGTLFIDEGFGSLDADILEEVIDMLEQVRAGEDRVIGLVSQVEGVKQRLEPRISVRRHPQRAGVSTLEVHV